MDRRQHPNRNGQQSPFDFGSTPSTPPLTSSSSGRQQLSSPFFGNVNNNNNNASILQSSIGLTTADLQYLPNNGVYYNNPPTMHSPPPGFAAVQQQNAAGLPPGYQHILNMQNVHLQQQCPPQNLCHVGGFPQQQQQQIPPMFNNNFTPLDLGEHSVHYDAISSLQAQMQKHPEYNMYDNNVNNNNHGMMEFGQSTSLGNRSATGVSCPTTDRNISPIDKTFIAQKSGIEPLIDNIVGSMIFNGVNGTYTHFGPSGSTAFPPTEFERHNNNEAAHMEFVGSSGQTPALATNYKTIDTKIVEQRQESPTPRGQQQQSSGSTGHIAPQIIGRSSTPSGENTAAENTSRPQTPNKPSYSEILAKSNVNQSGASTPTYRRATSTATSSASSQPATSKSSYSNQPITSTANPPRKSDGTSVSSGSSANSSSCTSLSSSPIAKQKTLSQTIMGRLFTTSTFGKENTATPTSRTSYFSYNRTPPASTTPTHRRKSVNEIKRDDRKVLQASQNSGENLKLKVKAKFNKGSTSSIHSDPAVDEQTPPQSSEQQEDDGDWKTYSRNKHATTTNRPTQLLNASNSKSTTNEEFSNKDENKVASNNDDDADEDIVLQSEEGDVSGTSRRETDKTKSGQQSSTNSTTTNVGNGSQQQTQAQQRKSREKERPKNKKDCRVANAAIQRCQRIVYLWGATMISAVAWLVKLVTDVFTLSISVGSTLMEDLYSWWINKAVPGFLQQVNMIEETFRVSCRKLKQSVSSWNRWPFRRKLNDENSDLKKNSQDLLAALGPDKNIQITNADETLKRLLSCKGQDPYSILGVRSDSSDETIRRYYKKQAVLVHPDKNLVVGAEEAFKILGRAFEFIGESSKRQEYHSKLLEAHAKEQVYGEIGKLLEQLRKKMEIATSSIRCTKCNLRHKKNKTDRPLFACRFCSQCNIHHAAREGELWAESKGWFKMSWNYFTCMDCHIWEINEWAKCQKKNLMHIKADSHCVMYRLVAGGGNGGTGQQSGGGNPGQGPDGQFHVDPEDDWDSLINNLCKTGGVPGNKGDHFYQQGNGSAGNFYTGGASGTANASSSTTNGAAAGRKRKGKRK